MMRVEIKERLDNNTFKVVRSGVSSRITLSGLGDYNPEPGTEAFVIPVGNDPDDFVMIAVNDGKIPESDAGERLIYSVSGGDVKAVIHLKNTGEVEIKSNEGGASIVLNTSGEIVLNGGGNSATMTEPLQTALNLLSQGINANLSLIAAVPALGGAYVPVPVSVDVTLAKQTKVKL